VDADNSLSQGEAQDLALQGRGRSFTHAAFLVFPAASAGTGIVAARTGRQTCPVFQALTLPQGCQLRDEGTAVSEETLVALAKIVEAVLAVRRPEEAVFRTPAVAHVEDVAGPASTGK